MLTAIALALGIASSDAAFDSRLDRIFAASGLPGAGVCVALDGKVIYQRAFGVADVDTKAPTQVNSAFEIGSLSKQFAAVAILMLVQEGKVDLEAKMGELLPDLPEEWRDATLDQVLHHMSGIPDYEEIAGYDFYNQQRLPKEIIEEARKKKPEFKPGEQFQYSNTGYYLVSMVVQAKSGMPSGRFLTKRIFEPLGMTSTYADLRPADAKPMTGYHSRTGSRVKQPPIAWSSTLGAGGIVSTAADLVKWDSALYGDRLVRQDLLGKIWTPTKLKNGTVNPYGYGWFSSTFRGTRQLDHSGQTNGFTCFYKRFPEKKCSVWVFSNTYAGRVFDLMNAAAGHFVPGASYRLLPVANPDPDPQRTQTHLKALRQAVYAEGEMELLARNIKDFATQDRFKEIRGELRSYLDAHKSWAFIRVSKRTIPTGPTYDDHFYRQELVNGETKFWTLGYRDGLLSSIRVEDE